MPSSFEPCGISQMLAMREGQPCLVNRVGGLRDTIDPNQSGFAFEGENSEAQAKALIQVFTQALDMYLNDADQWEIISQTAKDQRFSWDKSAQAYIEKLYCS